MGRPRKSEKQKAQEKLAKLLNISAPSPEEEIQQARTEEAIIAFAENPAIFTKVKCKRCSKIFGVNRKHIAFCSDTCRKLALKDLGIIRDPANEPRGLEDKKWVYRVYWGNEPLIVPPNVVAQMEEKLSSEQLITSTHEIVESTGIPYESIASIDHSSTGYDDLDAILNGS